MRALLYILMDYLNNAFKKDTNYFIALALATNVGKIPSWTLDQAAAFCNVSKATLNRFCKELGYQNYTRLRFIASLDDEKDYELFDAEYRRKKLDAISKTLATVDSVNDELFRRIGKMVMGSDEVFFCGYGKYLNCALKAQIDLMIHKKMSTARIDFIRQVESIRESSCDKGLVICVSMGGRSVAGFGLREAVSSKGFQSVLITRSHDEELLAPYDAVIDMGEDFGFRSSTYGVDYVMERITNAFYTELKERNIWRSGGR